MWQLFRQLNIKTRILFLRNWLSIVKTAITFVVPILILNHFFWRNPELIKKIIDKVSLPTFVIIDDLINFIVLIYVILYMVVAILLVDKAGQGKKISVVDSYKNGWRVFGQYLWVKVLLLFKCLCWSLLFIVPGFIYGVLYNFSGMAYLIDHKKGDEALKISKTIIKTNIKKYLFCVLGMSTILIIASVVFIYYFDSLIIFFTLRASTKIVRIINYAEVTFIAVAVFYFLIFYYYLYKDLSGDNEAH